MVVLGVVSTPGRFDRPQNNLLLKRWLKRGETTRTDGEETMSENSESKELFAGPPEQQQVCRDQVQRTKFVEREHKRFAGRLERDKVAFVFGLTVYAFNCTDGRHNLKETPHPFHLDYVAGGGHSEVPGAVQATIHALEHALAELKKRVQ